MWNRKLQAGMSTPWEIIEEKDENKIFLGHQVTNIGNLATNLVIETDKQQIECKHLINCAGLHSDKLTKLGGQKPPAKIIPFKGEYFELKEDAKHLCKNLIYPVPDPGLSLSWCTLYPND
jgi:L-2-hydroxyglutarate oxidase